MFLVTLLSAVSAACAGALALLILLRSPKSLPHRVFAAGMLLLALESTLASIAASADWFQNTVALKRCGLIVLALQPATWLLFALVYSRGNYQEFLLRWKWPLIGLLIFPLGISVLSFQQLIIGVIEPEIPWRLHYVLGWPGTTINAFLLLTAVLVLMNLERTFRAAVGTMRWRIKLVTIGMGTLFVARIYTSSQALLYHSINSSLDAINAGALVICCCILALSVVRTGEFSIDVYPSHALLHRSLTVLFAGVYLVIVGVFARLVTEWGGDTAFPLKAFFVLLSLVLLALLLLSDRIRQQTSLLISQHLRRPRYDYRQVWRTLTARTAGQVTGPALAQVMVTWLSETFSVLSASVWLVDEMSHRLVYGASTSLSAERAQQLAGKAADMQKLMDALRRQDKILDLDHVEEPWAECLRKMNPDVFEKKGGHRFCLPLSTQNELLGVLILGDRVNGLPFSSEDAELLQCIADHTANGLLNIRLSQRLALGKEMEAFQTMSTFFVHDLKNTAATLSLMLQNLPKHFDDANFREDALRAIAKSVERINQLIGQLGLLRQKLKLCLEPRDLNELVSAAVRPLEAAQAFSIIKELGSIPSVPLDAEQMHKVVTNLVLNAKEALNPHGQIQIRTALAGDRVVLTVSDDGCGMTQEFLEHSLFRPFQTTKKRGVGIGMFHTQKIVEAHGGRIEVESEPGKGTVFRILLPIGIKHP